MATTTIKVRVRLAWWFWPMIAVCYPLIRVAARYKPDQVEAAVHRIAVKALRAKVG